MSGSAAPSASPVAGFCPPNVHEPLLRAAELSRTSEGKRATRLCLNPTLCGLDLQQTGPSPSWSFGYCSLSLALSPSDHLGESITLTAWPFTHDRYGCRSHRDNGMRVCRRYAPRSAEHDVEHPREAV